jgi:GDPmannose 4,6-dehydratase
LNKVALITGVTGQDGAYLSEFLLNKGYDENGKCIIAVDSKYFRPAEVETLLGDAKKARIKLKWAPKISFDGLVNKMVFEDLKSIEFEELVKQHGYK